MELKLEKLNLPGVEDKRPLVMAGPCSAETEEQVITTAQQLSKIGVKIFRAQDHPHRYLRNLEVLKE